MNFSSAVQCLQELQLVGRDFSGLPSCTTWASDASLALLFLQRVSASGRSKLLLGPHDRLVLDSSAIGLPISLRSRARPVTDDQ